MRKNICILAVLALTALSSRAQSFQQAFFLDGYTLAYRYNPAIQNEGAFLSVGQLESHTLNNVGMASFLYPRDGEVVTGLHSSVSAQELLGNLQPDNYLSGHLNVNLFSYGWRQGENYHTLEGNIRAHYGVSIPREIFAVLKQGPGHSVHEMGGLHLWGSGYGEVAYGYSRRLSSWITVGARAKLLLGVESLDYNMTRLDVSASEEAVTASVEANLDLTSRWATIPADEDGYYRLLDLRLLSSNNRWKGPSGGGLAVDLGVLLTPAEGLTMSASVVDLGGIFWYFGNAGKSQGTTTFTGLDGLTLEEIKGDGLSEKFNELKEEFMQTLKIKALDSRMSFAAVPFQVNLGAKYELPFYRPLSVGATGNFLFQRGMNYREGRVALAWNPRSWLGMSADIGTGTYGMVYGLALNAAFKRIRFTAAWSNGFGGTLGQSGVPLRANNKFITLGLAYDLGK